MKDTLNFTIGNFLTVQEKEAVKSAVREAESKTAGEIKVLVVGKSRTYKDAIREISAEDAIDARADREFLSMGIQDTRDRTGVLIMVSLKERRVAIRADKSINDKVDPGTWEKYMNMILEGIKQHTPGDGICNAVIGISQLLSEHFPIKEDDTNELPDDVEFKE